MTPLAAPRNMTTVSSNGVGSAFPGQAIRRPRITVGGYVQGGKPFTTWPSLSNRRSGPAIGVASSGCLAWAAGYVPSFRGGLLDMCEFAHPEIRNPDPTGNYEIHPAPSQSDLQRQLRKQSH
jgi:hypothetical protein